MEEIYSSQKIDILSVHNLLMETKRINGLQKQKQVVALVEEIRDGRKKDKERREKERLRQEKRAATKKKKEEIKKALNNQRKERKKKEQEAVKKIRTERKKQSKVQKKDVTDRTVNNSKKRKHPSNLKNMGKSYAKRFKTDGLGESENFKNKTRNERYISNRMAESENKSFIDLTYDSETGSVDEEKWTEFKKQIDIISFNTFCNKVVKNDEDFQNLLDNFFNHDFDYPSNNQDTFRRLASLSNSKNARTAFQDWSIGK